jgi:hypothetical protein
LPWNFFHSKSAACACALTAAMTRTGNAARAANFLAFIEVLPEPGFACLFGSLLFLKPFSH